MRVGVPSETEIYERRVAMVPDVVARLVKKSHEVTVQAGAGAACWFDDDTYLAKGAQVAADAAAAFSSGELICKVQPPSVDEVALIPPGTALISFLQPTFQLELVRRLAEARVTAFSLDLLPRISRAQAMDALSSQATVSGYMAALLAAQRLGRFFPMFMTAAGTVPPAKVLVMGAGVAGLQAIATARRLGAVVRAYDVRPAAAEEVRSLGAKFVELPLEAQEGSGGYAKEQSEEFLTRQREMLTAEVAAADAVITTAAIPGRRAPVLVTKEMVAAMAPGAVIVDLAAETGGNVELSEPGEELIRDGVLIIGARNMPSSMPVHASFLLARNMAEFIGLASRDGAFALDFNDEIISGTCVTHDGKVLHGPTRELLETGVATS